MNSCQTGNVACLIVHVSRERLLSFQYITFEMILMCISYYREVYFTWVYTFARRIFIYSKN